MFLAHIDRLKKFHGAPEPALSGTSAPKATSRRYAVHRILDHRVTTHGSEYHILWEPCEDNDWDPAECSWQREEDLACAEKLQTYHKEEAWEMGALLRHAPPADQPPQEPVSSTRVHSDILDNDPSTLLLRICHAAGVNPKRVLFVWGSPPCTTMSRADPSNTTRDNHYRDHSNPERPPKSWDILDPKVRTAVEHDRFLPTLIQMVTADRQRDLNYNFMFENPQASLRRRPYMQISAWPRVLEVVRQTVDLCAFGHYYRKGTDLWTSLTSWEPKGTTGNGRCQHLCGQGATDPESGCYRHFFALAVEPKRAKQGPGATAMRQAMPPQLLREVLRVAQLEAPVHQDIVIDICAGNGSMEKPALEAGLHYIGVDIRFDTALRC